MHGGISNTTDRGATPMIIVQLVVEEPYVIEVNPPLTPLL
jgi:predicted ATP-grasp superfamily ATP-dependent carboligase